MSDIFVSYAKEDRDRVEPLARALTTHGWDVFWDRAIPTGKLGGETAAPPITFAIDGRQVIALAVGRAMFVFEL